MVLNEKVDTAEKLVIVGNPGGTIIAPPEDEGEWTVLCWDSVEEGPVVPLLVVIVLDWLPDDDDLAEFEDKLEGPDDWLEVANFVKPELGPEVVLLPSPWDDSVLAVVLAVLDAEDALCTVEDPEFVNSIVEALDLELDLDDDG